MNYIFDIFFEDAVGLLERNGLHSRQARRDMIDRLNSIINGGAMGGQGSTDECAVEAIVSAIEFHRRYKSENSEVNYTTITAESSSKGPQLLARLCK